MELLIEKDNTQLIFKQYGSNNNIGEIFFSLIDGKTIAAIYVSYSRIKGEVCPPNIQVRICDNRYPVFEHYQQLIPLMAKMIGEWETFIKEPQSFIEQESWKVEEYPSKG
jgi:hypothetical protein